MLSTLKRTLLIAVAGGLLTGCATSPDTDYVPGDQEGLIVVDNTTTTLGAATIYLVPETGVRDQLGNVPPNREEEFLVEPDLSFRYHLVANVGTEELVSREFTFTDNTAVEWDLDTNTVTFPVLDP